MLSRRKQQLWLEAVNVLTELLENYYELDRLTANAIVKCYVIDGQVDLVDFSNNHGNQMLYRAYIFDIGYLYDLKV